MKKVMIPVVALLMLFAVTPVMAAPATKIPFTGWAGFGFGNLSPGEEWMTADGVYHIKGAMSVGNVSIESALGPMWGIMIMEHDLALDLNTGLGDCHGKFVITIFEGGTFEGSEHGSHIITDHHYISGGLVAKGTGIFEGLKMTSSYEGEILTVDTQMIAVVDMEGTLLSPKG